MYKYKLIKVILVGLKGYGWNKTHGCQCFMITLNVHHTWWMTER